MSLRSAASDLISWRVEARVAPPRWTPGVGSLFATLLLSGLLLQLDSSAQESTAAATQNTPATTNEPKGAALPGTPGLAPVSSDLGPQPVLQRQSFPRLFRFYSDTQVMHVSNVLLADGELVQEGPDALLFQSFGASLNLPLIRPLTTTLFGMHDIVRYDEFSKFDFDADTGGVRLGLPVAELFQLYGAWFAGRDYYREGGKEFFKFYDTRAGLYRQDSLYRRTRLTYGYQFDWRPSSPSVLTRMDNALYTELDATLIDKLTGQLFYRARFRSYLETDRADVDQLIGFNLIYAFNEMVNLRGFVTYAVNRSSQSDKEYDVFNGGGGLNVSIRF